MTWLEKEYSEFIEMKNRKVYIIEDDTYFGYFIEKFIGYKYGEEVYFDITETTYGELVENNAYTLPTPKGVKKEYFMEADEVKIDDEDEYDEDQDEEIEGKVVEKKEPETKTVYRVKYWSRGDMFWGPKILDEFDTEEEAEIKLFEIWEHDMRRDDSPSYYFSLEDAKKWLAENYDEEAPDEEDIG